MKKVLIIAPYFIPRRRVGALRPYKFVKHLREFGWEPSVLCIQESNSELTEIEKSNLEGIEVFKLQTPLDRTSTTKPTNTTSSKPKGKEDKLAKWIDDHFPIDTWLPFLWIRKKEIKHIIQQVNPDVIWSTSDPWSGGYIAGKIARELNKIWIADFRDPWTLCSVRFQQKGVFTKRIEKKAEKWIVNNSDFMTFTAKETENKYIRNYPELSEKSETIYNSFDVDQEPNKDIVNTISDKLDILFLGTFRWLSHAKMIIEILDDIKKKEPVLFNNIRLSSYGNLDNEDLKLASEKDVLEAFQIRKKVPVEFVQDEISQSDILLLSTHSERDDIVPAKLLDYLPSNKPIISLVPNKEVGDILNVTGRGIQFDKDEINQASDLIIQCLKAKIKGDKLPFNLIRNEDKISDFNSRSTTKQLAKVLTRVSEHE